MLRSFPDDDDEYYDYDNDADDQFNESIPSSLLSFYLQFDEHPIATGGGGGGRGAGAGNRARNGAGAGAGARGAGAGAGAGGGAGGAGRKRKLSKKEYLEASSIAKKKLEERETENDIKCPICYMTKRDGLTRSKLRLFLCSHYVCRECFPQMCNNECPICREFITLA